MKILIVNKFLHPNGGSETYIFKLGKYLSEHGHEVQYFGMEHEGRIVGNRVNAYTSDMDFHGGRKIDKLTYPIKTIYSSEARKKIRLVLDDFCPEIVHLNNFTYQLTPSIILEIVKWRNNNNNKSCKIIFTAHDYNLICPNHMLYNPNTHEVCEKCLDGNYVNCIKGKCIHGSRAKSIVGAAEAYFWKWKGTYKFIDKVICPSEFLKRKMDTNPVFDKKTVTLHNFVDHIEIKNTKRQDYVLYFGRYCEEKGINTLIDAVKQLPEIPFVFAGSGCLEKQISGFNNVNNVGYIDGEKLDKLIREARFVLCPSVVNENCPFSVMESQARGTPVVGSRIGGIPELIDDGINGKLFESENSVQLSDIIKYMYYNPDVVKHYQEELYKIKRDEIDKYALSLLDIYNGGGVTVSIPILGKYVLYFGRLTEEKGIRFLINVIRKTEDVHYVIAGTGPASNLLQGLENVEYVGFKEKEELHRLILNASLTIHPSEWYENCPYSIIESQLMGTPVLASKIGGIPELVEDGETGYLYKPGDIEDCKRKMYKMLSCNSIYTNLKVNCETKSFMTIERYLKILMKLI